MKICVRVDDIGWTDRVTANPPAKQPDVGLQAAQRFHAAMQGCPWLAAVIPAIVDKAGAQWLASAPQGVTLAAHGWDHRTVDGVTDEYRGLDRTGCSVRTKAAQQVMRKFMPRRKLCRHFVPPFNRLGAYLREALPRDGFEFVWGAPSKWPTPPEPHGAGGFKFIPSWLPLYAATRREMNKDTPPLLPKMYGIMSHPGVAVCTLHLPWELADDEGFSGVREFVSRWGDHIISPAEYLSHAT